MEMEKTLGMSDYVSAFRRRQGLMIAVALPVFIIVTLVAFALPSIYKSTAVFRLRDTTSSDQSRQRYIDKYITGLTDYVFKQTKPEEISRQLRAQDVHVAMISEKVLDPDSGRDKEINTGFSVAYEDRSAKSAQLVASWLSDAFLKGSREDALATAGSQLKFFSDEVERTRAKIAELESKVADFKKQNIDQLPASAQTNLAAQNQAEQELDAIERDVSAQQQNRIFLMQQLETAKANTGSGASLAQLEDQYKRDKAVRDESHPDMIAMRRQIQTARAGVSNEDGSLKSELESQRSILAETRLRYGEDYPDVRRLVSSIKALEARIAAGEKSDPSAIVASNPVVVQLSTQIHATDTQIASLQARRASLRGRSEDLARRVASTPAVERQYEGLDRDLGTARAQYQGLLNQRLEAEVKSQAIVSGAADPFVLVQPAAEPWMAERPLRGVIVMLGALGSLILAFVSALGAELLDGSVRGSHDVLHILAVSPLAIIPEIRNGDYRRRFNKQLLTAASSAVLGIPVLYFCIRLLVQ
jgi:succinoglycan biosynthesis transport protein ExoP